MSPLVRWITFLVLFVLVVVIFILGLTFYDRNSQMVVMDYFLGSKEYYFSFWLFGSMSIGIVLGWLTICPIILKLKRHNIKLLRQIKVKEKEINNLRVLPVKDTR